MRKKKLLTTKSQETAASVSQMPRSVPARLRPRAKDAPVPILQRAHTDPHAIDASGIRLLQRTIGNQAVGRLLIQRKLTLGPTGDRYEQEADQVAKQVAASLPADGRPGAQRQEEARVQAKAASSAAGGPISDEIENDIQSARSSGQPLPNHVRAPMENAFGADFSGVKVHTGSQSDNLNQSVQARAFTTGQDIFFRQGEYSPGSSGGQELLAHELTHVVQQNGSAVQRQEQPSQPQLQADGDSIQRMKPLPSDPAARRKEIQRRIRAGQLKRKKQKELDNSYLGRFASWVGFSYTAAPEAEAEEEEEEGVASIKGEEDTATYEAERTWGQYKEDEEEDDDDDGEKDPLGIKEIEIDLGEIDGELATRLGKLKGSAKASRNIEGYKGEASAKLGDDLATAKLKGELTESGLKGEGELGLSAAATNEHKSGVMGWKLLGGELQGQGAIEEFIGLKGEASAKGKVSKGKGSLKGKASAFVGAEIKGNVNVKLKVGGSELSSARGELGATFGIGGSLEGKIAWENGVIELGGKGKLAAGLGFSYGYEVKIDTNKIGEVLSSRLLPSWLSWDTLQTLGNLGSYLFGG